MLAKTVGFAVAGVEGRQVLVEVDLASGMPAYSTVGLPDAAVRESKERVVAALRNSGFDFPPRRVTVNLAPAEMRKAGTQLDLPIALGVLAASGQLKPAGDLGRTGFIGEVALDGTLRPVRGALAMALEAADCGLESLVVPLANAPEAAAVPLRVFAAAHLKDVVAHLEGRRTLAPASASGASAASPSASFQDLADVRGQAFARRALEVAAAGGHNLLFIGPPGTGKSMLARRLPGILPPMTPEEALEATRIHSITGLLAPGAGLLAARPFRAPHHTLSDVALVGGRSPGEISLAHHGVLFLDEMPEFDRNALEALRQPLEDGWISVSRAFGSHRFPARFMLVGAMNPCPCGYAGHPTRACACTPIMVRKYRTRVSGPLWDRVDLHVELAPVAFAEYAAEAAAESSAAVRARVESARARQVARLAGTGAAPLRPAPAASNARMSPKQVRAHCRVDAAGQALLEKAMDRLGLSARSLERILRVARTVADLEGSPAVERAHLVEAIGYRTLDRSAAALAAA